MGTPMNTNTQNQMQTARALGKRRTCEFLSDLARKTPVKSRRMTLAAEIVSCERERERVSGRLRKNKKGIADLVAKVHIDEIEEARLTNKIESLKQETTVLESELQ